MKIANYEMHTFGDTVQTDHLVKISLKSVNNILILLWGEGNKDSEAKSSLGGEIS